MTTNIAVDLLATAITYRTAGLSIIATLSSKAPFAPWGEYQYSPPNDDQLIVMFEDSRAARIGIVCGKVSGNLECIDFDAQGVAFEAWRDLVAADDPAALDNTVIETTPAGGLHVIYRCPGVVIPGAQKLAMRPLPSVDGGRPKFAVLAETRGEGGYFCAAPSAGYELFQGELTAIPEVTPDQREIFIRSARFLNETPVQEEYPQDIRTAMPGDAGHDRPGDDYNHSLSRDGMAELLTRHGWTFWRTNGENAAWTRPGKTKGLSATLRNIDGVEVFYVFSSSTAFTPMRGYSPFQVFATLEHGGDFASAASALGSQGYGGHSIPYDDFDIDAFHDNHFPARRTPSNSSIRDPGPFPEKLLNVPGFINDLTEHINRRAIKRQPILALGAAIAVLGCLTGRKVEGATGLRTNFYCLGVADSGDGKDKPREVIRQLLYESGNDDLYSSDRLKSDAGIRSALEANPNTLFLLDEMGELLSTIKSAKSSPWLKNIITELLTLYSSAGSSGIKMGGYADAKRSITIDCPHVCLFGTSVPESVFKSMTMDSVTGGFLGRLLIFESNSKNPRKQNPCREPIPESVLSAARWWRDFEPSGSLTGNYPGSTSAPIRIDESATATRIFDECEEQVREFMGGLPGQMASPLKRVEENARKLSLIHACSASRETPFIGEMSARWGSDLALYLARRLVYLADINVADNDTHEKLNRVLRIILEEGEAGIRRSQLINKCRFLKVRELNEILESLIASGSVTAEPDETATRTAMRYCAN